MNETNIQDVINKRSFSRKRILRWYLKCQGLFEVEKVILNRLKSSIRGKSLLDVGVGGGRTTKFLLDISEEYIGVDYTAGFVESARKNYPHATFVLGDARDLRLFGDRSFDFALFSYNGIDYMPHDGRLCALNEINRVLKPGGYFMFSTHNLNYKHVRKITWHEDSFSNPASFKGRLSELLHWPKHLIMKRHEFYNDEYAILNDSANEYSLLTYFIGIDEQIKQLQDRGFVNTQVYDLKGNQIQHDSDSPWIYFLATKSTS